MQTKDVNVEMLAVENLHSNPLNPRRELGDLSELKDSIVAKGILQPLVVMRGYKNGGDSLQMDGYTILIGHRRASAAKQAGMSEVPCIVKEYLSTEEQISVMSIENMIRSGLSYAEQGKAMEQLTMSGMSIAEVAKATGFSSTTVRNRLKIADLDAKASENACEQGATLEDLLAISDITDEKAREELLKVAGSQNFSNSLRSARYEQAREQYIEAVKQFASSFASQLPEDADRTGYRQIAYYSSYDFDKSNPTDVSKLQIPSKIQRENGDSIPAYWEVTQYGVTIHCKSDDLQEEGKTSEELKAWRNESSTLLCRVEELANRINDQHIEFAKSFIDNEKADEKALFYGVAKAFLDHWYLSTETVSCLTGVKSKDMQDEIEKNPSRMVRAFVMANALNNDICKRRCDNLLVVKRGEREKFVDMYESWVDAKVVSALETFGYEPSDEEKSVLNGTHPLIEERNALKNRIYELYSEK